MSKTRQSPAIDHFRHTIEVDQEAEEDFISCRTIFMDPAQITEDGDAWHVLAMKCQDTGCLAIPSRGAFGWRYMPADMLMLPVIRSRDLRQKPCHHFDNIRDRHRANLILLASILSTSQRPTRSVDRSSQYFFRSKTLYMVQIADLDSGRRGSA